MRTHYQKEGHTVVQITRDGIYHFYTLALINCMICISFCNASVEYPFPHGQAMATLATIIDPYGISGRQPWVSAGYYAGPRQLSFAVSGIQYYDMMDNMNGFYTTNASLGMLASSHGFYTTKIHYSYFNAFSIYYEHRGHLSCALRKWERIIPSVDISATECGLQIDPCTYSRSIETGFSLHARWKWCHLRATLQKLRLYSTGEYVPAPRFDAGIHTISHSYGMQGVRINTTCASRPQTRVYIGESFAIGNAVDICLSIASAPLLFSCGITIKLARHTTSLSVCRHPVLGWSEGLMYEWHKTK